MLTVDYDLLGLEPYELVLDLGCGFGRHAFEVVRRGARVVACDISLPEIETARDTCAAMSNEEPIPSTASSLFLAGDAIKLPFPDNTFDRVIASEILEHVADDQSAILELHRVLKPAGVLAATVPAFLPERICWALSETYHAPAAVGGHVRIYTRAKLTAKLRLCGLTPIDFHRAHAFHSPYWWLKCAVGTDNETNVAVKTYHRFLTWQIVNQPRIARLVEKMLNPFLGKSAVIYARKPSLIRESPDLAAA